MIGVSLPLSKRKGDFSPVAPQPIDLLEPQKAHVAGSAGLLAAERSGFKKFFLSLLSGLFRTAKFAGDSIPNPGGGPGGLRDG